MFLVLGSGDTCYSVWYSTEHFTCKAKNQIFHIEKWYSNDIQYTAFAFLFDYHMIHAQRVGI